MRATAWMLKVSSVSFVAMRLERPDAAPGSPANADEQRGERLELAAASGSRNEIPAEDELRAWASDSSIEMLRGGAGELSRRQREQSQSSTEAPPSAAKVTAKLRAARARRTTPVECGRTAGGKGKADDAR